MHGWLVAYFLLYFNVLCQFSMALFFYSRLLRMMRRLK